MNKITIECTWYKSKRDFNKFVRSIEEESVLVIDYMIIFNKLMKADPDKLEPSDSIVGLNIINTLNRYLDEERQKVPGTIVYSFRELREDTILNFRKLIESNTDREYTMALNVLNMPRTPKKEILNKFDHVKFIDND